MMDMELIPKEVAFKKTVATLETQYGKVEVSYNEVDISIETMYHEVIVPLLLATGYTKEQINRLFPE